MIDTIYTSYPKMIVKKQIHLILILKNFTIKDCT